MEPDLPSRSKQLYLYLLGVKRAELSEQLDTFITGLSKMEEVPPEPQTSKLKWKYSLKKAPSRVFFSGEGGGHPPLQPCSSLS
jgi:hypothetical protein